jgi:hypothetical protein
MDMWPIDLARVTSFTRSFANLDADNVTQIGACIADARESECERPSAGLTHAGDVCVSRR